MLKNLAESEVVQGVLWAVAFVGVCVLVGLGKLKPETVEMLLIGIVAKTATGKRPS